MSGRFEYPDNTPVAVPLIYKKGKRDHMMDRVHNLIQQYFLSLKTEEELEDDYSDFTIESLADDYGMPLDTYAEMVDVALSRYKAQKAGFDFAQAKSDPDNAQPPAAESSD